MTQLIAAQDEMVRKDVRGADAGRVASDPAAAAEAALAGALAYCEGKMGLAGPLASLNQVRFDPAARGYFQYGLAGQVAAYLARLDNEVEAAYLYDYEATPDDVAFGAAQAGWPMHLIIRARRKTKALAVLADALGEALAQRCAADAGVAGQALLDFHMVDAVEAERGTGDGALLKSMYLPPLLVWER